jgi:polar amino acid transport system substrate-binding protein
VSKYGVRWAARAPSSSAGLQARNEQVTILAPYFRERLVVARNRLRIPQLPTLQVFSHEKIGVQAETLEDQYLMQSFGGLPHDNVVHFGSMLDAAIALRKNEVPAVMGRQTIIEAGLDGDAAKFEIAAVATPGMVVSGWDLGVAVKADYPDLAAAIDKAMAELRKDGAGAAKRSFRERDRRVVGARCASSDARRADGYRHRRR